MANMYQDGSESEMRENVMESQWWWLHASSTIGVIESIVTQPG